MAMIRGVLVSLVLCLNLTFWGILVLTVGLLKFFTPERFGRRRVILLLAWLGDSWVGLNNRIFDVMLPIEWDIQGVEGLRRDGHYLIFANHVSWADILVAFRTFHNRLALLRFFAKQNVIWFPFVGQACWALDFPFMKRYSAEYLARHPEKRGTDLETTRRACERYRDVPVAVLNFLEATRFTPAKHAEQESPYRTLLRPRAGAAAFVVASLGDQLDAILDLTIAYPGRVITFWEFVSGRVRRVTVRVRLLSAPPDPMADRERFKEWIESAWREKDEILATL